MLRPPVFVALACLLLAGARATEDTKVWQPVVWNGERALVAESESRKAIVSLERSRLMFFGPAAPATNLLLAPATRDNRNYWGGHRLWLGPQSTWAKIWPPPDAWEYRGPESFTTDAGVLRLLMPDAGDGWPRLTRTYRWAGPRLVCGAELHGGTRPAQIIHILQVPPEGRVLVAAVPETAAPDGYVLLPAGDWPKLTAQFKPPLHVTPLAGHALELRHVEAVLKPGFRPQALIAHRAGFALHVERGEQRGRVVAEPDAGFFTQVYLGGSEPFTELEQLSPAWSPAEPASFEIIVSAEPDQPAAAR